MDDAAAGSEQARGLRRALGESGIGVGTLWLQHFRLGGEIGEVEIDAYLHLALELPRLERDLLAHAANELIAPGTGLRAPYSADLVGGDHGEPSNRGGEPGDGDGGSGAAAQ